MNYKTKYKVFGLPLIHITSGKLVDNHYKRGIAKGWIAIGDISFGVIFSAGAVAFGGIAIGGLSIGLLSFAGLALGVFSLAGGEKKWFFWRLRLIGRYVPYALKDLEIASIGSRPNTRYGIIMDKSVIEVVL